MANNMQQPDTLLIEALRNGHFNALDDFYKAHREEFVRWSYKNFSLDESASADIYQDAFVVLYKNITHGRLVSLQASLKTYLFGICRNLIMDKFRSVQKERKETGNIRMEWYEHNAVEVFLPQQEQQELIIESVKSALKKMSSPCRQILKLFYFEKLDMRTIAGKMGYENENVVKSQKVRCLKYLKQFVGAATKANDV